MDRSFLSDARVIDASRKLVCIRLLSYENEAEMKFLKSFRITRSGEVENTTVVLLSSDGERRLSRAARGPREVFGDAANMAAAMDRTARENPGRESPADEAELPGIASVRLAVDVAACDNRPLAVIYARGTEERRALELRLAPLAWSDEFRGRFIWAATDKSDDVSTIDGAKPGVLVVQPDRFGQKATVLKRVGLDPAHAELIQLLRDGLAKHKTSEKSFRDHVRAGHQQGVFWETALPVTDPMERNARERGRRP
jgi:hypothetical protein